MTVEAWVADCLVSAGCVAYQRGGIPAKVNPPYLTHFEVIGTKTERSGLWSYQWQVDAWGERYPASRRLADLSTTALTLDSVSADAELKIISSWLEHEQDMGQGAENLHHIALTFRIIARKEG